MKTEIIAVLDQVYGKKSININVADKLLSLLNDTSESEKVIKDGVYKSDKCIFVFCPNPDDCKLTSSGCIFHKPTLKSNSV